MRCDEMCTLGAIVIIACLIAWRVTDPGAALTNIAAGLVGFLSKTLVDKAGGA